MLYSKEVDIVLSSSNMKYYEDKGYYIPREKNKINRIVVPRGTKIRVKIEDVPVTSGVEVLVECDICHSIVSRKYIDYIRRMEKDEFKIDSCDNCKYEKIKIEKRIKSESNMFERHDNGYYLNRENRLKDVREYFKRYGTVENLGSTEEGSRLSAVLSSYNENIRTLAMELELITLDDLNRVPNGWYDKIENVSDSINKLVVKYNRFPTLAEITSEYGCDITRKLGGINQVKELMGYVDDFDMVDDRNYFNRSAYEYHVAQYLIHNDIAYDRDVVISPNPEIDGYYNCDFVLYPIEYPDGIWIEVWGGYGKGLPNYIQKHDLKKKIYEKYNKRLVSIYPKIFDKKSFEDIQSSLYDILNPYIKLKYKKIDNALLSCYKSISNDDLLKEVMKLTDNQKGILLPTFTKIKESDSSLYYEIIRRFKTCENFGKVMNKIVAVETRDYSNQEEVYKYYDYMINKYNKILNRNEVLDYIDNDDMIKAYNKVLKNVHKYGGIYNLRIGYIERMVDNNIKIIPSELSWLYSTSRYTPKKNTKKQLITKEHIEKMNKLINTIENSNLYKKTFWLSCKISTQEWNLNKMFDMLDDMIETLGYIPSESETRTKHKQYSKFYSALSGFKVSLFDIKDLYYSRASHQ